MEYLSMYTQNVSGARSKLTKLNEALAISCFHIIMLQETWFNANVMTSELVAGTNYTALRGFWIGSNFANSRTTGGGVIILVKNGTNYEPVTLDLHTTLEFLVL